MPHPRIIEKENISSFISYASDASLKTVCVLHFYKDDLYEVIILKKNNLETDIILEKISSYTGKLFHETTSTWYPNIYYKKRYGEINDLNHEDVTFELGSLRKNNIHIRYIKENIFNEFSIEFTLLNKQPETYKL